MTKKSRNSGLVVDHLKKVLGLRRFFLGMQWLIAVFNSLLLAGFTLGLWAFLNPQGELQPIFLAFLMFLFSLLLFRGYPQKTPESKDFMLGMEMKYPEAKASLFTVGHCRSDSIEAEEWREILEQEAISFRKNQFKRLWYLVMTVPIPLLLFVSTFFITPEALTQAINKVSQAVAQLSEGSTLEIMSGATTETTGLIKLSDTKTVNLELLAQNMIAIKVLSGQKNARYQILLKKWLPGRESGAPDNPVFQSFQLSAEESWDAGSNRGEYRIVFSIADDVELYLSNLSTTIPAAIVKVRQLPIPKVNLEALTKLKNPWPDDRPLPLRISVSATNPLQEVRLIINTGGRTFKELVSNVVTADLKDISKNYNLILESYLQSDVAEVEIRAEAVDRAVPVPLVGQSQPILLTTASSYGRYRQTLQTLREMKSILDQAAEELPQEIDPRLSELMKKALEQSEDSPYFDGLDRVYLSRFDFNVKELIKNPSMMQVVETSEGLNEFLFEHEILDDKERDRDFFVAARSLSRLIEVPFKKRTVTVELVTGRMSRFLDSRFRRWQMRVQRLQKPPESWNRIKKRPFVKALQVVADLNQKENAAKSSESLVKLSQAVDLFREWIEELEEAENQMRRQQEQKRQQGLVSARNTLKELQKRQGDISKKLDRADQNSKEVENQWPAIRMKQNANIQGTSGLEAQLRSMAPRAGERIKAAVEAMKITKQAGNQGAYTQAESGSDMSGRLLRQAESAAQKAQNKQRRRGRRRRVTGDNYYGSQVAGGDVEIKRGYQVNRRYREDILEDVRRSDMDGGDKEQSTLLENYLRRVIR